MQKIGVILFAVSIIGLTNAEKPPICVKPNAFEDLANCCYQMEKTSYDIAFAKCYQRYVDTPNPNYCTTDCAMEEAGLGNRVMSLNYTNLRIFFENEVKDHVLVKFMMNTIQDCDKQITKMMQNPEYNTECKPCSPRSRLLHECSSIHAILNCPAQKWKKGDKYCEHILEDIKSFCPFNY